MKKEAKTLANSGALFLRICHTLDKSTSSHAVAWAIAQWLRAGLLTKTLVHLRHQMKHLTELPDQGGSGAVVDPIGIGQLIGDMSTSDT